MMTIAAALLASCGQNNESTDPANDMTDSTAVVMSFYGETITPEGAISIAELKAQMATTDSLETKVRATIDETCAKMGCWMTVSLGENEDMTVFMNDHAFFVPKEGCVGKEAIFSGIAYYDTLSVEYLRHLAEDANKSMEEIEAINEPLAALSFDARGVIIEGVAQPAAEESHDDHDHEGHDHAEGEEHSEVDAD